MTIFPGRARRRGSLAVAVFLAAIAVAPAAAQSETPEQQRTQVPGYYRMIVEDTEITALYDGFVRLDNTALLLGLEDDAIQRLLERQFIPAESGVQTAVTGYLIHTGSKLVLVDTGAGHCFGPTVGNLDVNMRAAGYEPSQVDAVLLTHMHGDHVCGLVTTGGERAFPNAQVWAAAAEADYWLSDKAASQAPDSAQGTFDTAQAAIAPYKAAEQFRTFEAGETLMPGISAFALPGHTPGHSGYLISTGAGDTGDLLIWGDTMHSFAVQFPQPETAIKFDVDSQQAIATRKKVLDHIAEARLWVAGAHLPFPGLGRIRAEGEGYAWVPIQYHPVGYQFSTIRCRKNPDACDQPRN